VGPGAGDESHVGQIVLARTKEAVRQEERAFFPGLCISKLEWLDGVILSFLVGRVVGIIVEVQLPVALVEIFERQHIVSRALERATDKVQIQAGPVGPYDVRPAAGDLFN